MAEAPTKTVRPFARVQDAERISLLSYLLQGSIFIGFLLLLFVLAGFRG